MCKSGMQVTNQIKVDLNKTVRSSGNDLVTAMIFANNKLVKQVY